MKRSVSFCLDSNIKYIDESTAISPIYPSEYYKSDEFLGHQSGKEQKKSRPRDELGQDQLFIASLPTAPTNNNIQGSITFHLINLNNPNKKSSITFSNEQIQNICRESQYFSNLIKDNQYPPPISPMRAASPLASSMRSRSPTYAQEHDSSPVKPKCSHKSIFTDGILIYDDNVNEAIYLLGILADLTEKSNLSTFSWKFNLVWARLCAKWKIQRFIEFLTILMDRELNKIIETRSCDVVMVCGENECVFTPHPKKPNCYTSKKSTKCSSIELISVVDNKDCENVISCCWELTIFLRRPDGTVAIGRTKFPCKSDSLLQDCSGEWGGHQLRFRLGKRDNKFIKAFISISDLVITNECYQHGEILHGKHDVKKLLCQHPELWTSEVFNKLFTKDELTEFMLLNCGPK